MLLLLHSYPYDRPDAAQRATADIPGGARAVLNAETDQWDILVNEKTYRKAVFAKFEDGLWGTHVGCASQARKSAKKTIRAMIDLLATEAPDTHYDLKDLEGLL